MATPRKALLWRAACGASPRTARTAPSASAPAGGGETERNQSVSEARTHPALRVLPPSFIGWARLEGVASGAAGGAPPGSVDKDCASRARPHGAEKRQCGGHTAHWSPEPPNRTVRRAALDLLQPWDPSRSLDATLLLNLIVLACVKRTLWRVHTWNAATLPRPTTVLDSAYWESSRTAAHLEGPPRLRISLGERSGGLRSQCTQAETGT